MCVTKSHGFLRSSYCGQKDSENSHDYAIYLSNPLPELRFQKTVSKTGPKQIEGSKNVMCKYSFIELLGSIMSSTIIKTK